jgi:hypothetical protein
MGVSSLKGRAIGGRESKRRAARMTRPVHVVSDRGLVGPEAKKLLGAVLDNWQLTLVSLGREPPKGLPAEWLRAVGEKR